MVYTPRARASSVRFNQALFYIKNNNKKSNSFLGEENYKREGKGFVVVSNNNEL